MSNYKKKQKAKRVVALFLTGTMLTAVPVVESNSGLSFWSREQVLASSAEDKRNEAQQNLNEVNNQMQELESQQNAVQNELSEKTAQLSELLGEKQILENDIKNTQVAIDQAKVDLAAAKKKEEEAYEAMKLRIQYMYENSTAESMWTAIFEANGIADMLNRVEYVTQVHKTDRELLAEYKAIVAKVEQLAAELDSKMNDLTTMQEVLAHQEADLNAKMEALKAESADYEQQLVAAKVRADEYAAEIARQNEIIRQEEIRREQERQEQLRREEEERRRQEQQQQASNSNSNNNNNSNNSSSNNNNNSNNSSSNNNNNSNNSSSNNNNSNNNSSSNNSSSNSNSGSLNDSDKDPAFSSKVTGTELVNYALQFVGNPYKWGGNSLTKGCDCSGFVNLIYKHFGFSVPRQSQAFKKVGKAVSYQNLKAGDIVVYPGHVAIYIGNGKIVEAQSTKAGITSNRKVNCSTITAIRRVL